MVETEEFKEISVEITVRVVLEFSFLKFQFHFGVFKSCFTEFELRFRIGLG